MFWTILLSRLTETFLGRFQEKCKARKSYKKVQNVDFF